MLNIAKKVIQINIRSSKFILFNALFPIFLIVLIGYMMSDEFYKNVNIDTVNITYYDEGSEQSSLILEEVLKNSKDMDVKLEEIDSIEKGKQSARLNESVFVHFDSDDIDVYANNKSPLDKAIVSSIFEGVNNKVNMMKVIYNENNQPKIEYSQNSSKDIIEIDKIPQDKAPNSFDYYGIVEITMIAMYAGAYPIYSMRGERRYNLNERIKLSSINNTKYYLGSFIGFCGLGIITTLPGYLFATLILKINVGNNILLPYLLILSLSFMFIAVGMIIECICKDTDRAANFIQSIIFP
ncbi:MAG: ABC transporter permease, partial [Paraclostridium sp.]